MLIITISITYVKWYSNINNKEKRLEANIMVGEFFTSVFGDSNMVVNIFSKIMEDGNMVGDFIGAIACIVGVI